MRRELPVVAIIGRPNVGKSTLFNCFAGERKSIVSDIPGTTRDSLIMKVSFDSAKRPEENEPDLVEFWLVDTAGLTNAHGESLEEEVQRQAELSMENAQLILFVIDAKKELTLDDEEIIRKLRRSQTPVIFIANKIDDGDETRGVEFAKIGFGLPLTISAKNYHGIWELEDAIEETLGNEGFHFHKANETQPPGDEINLAFVGRPNVGKSSLLNALLGTNRSVVSEIAGTTRDTIDMDYTDEEGQKFVFLDTAGLRRPGKIREDLEFWSSVRTNRAVERSDVCALLIDALDGVTHQDLALAGRIAEAGKGLILCVNKFDLVREKTRGEEESDDRELDEVKMWDEDLDKVRQKYLHYLSQKINFVPWAPVLFFSAKTGKGVGEVLQSAKHIFQERQKRVSTADLNRWVPEVFYGHVRPSVGTKVGKIKYVSQVDALPPKFIFFVNNAAAFHFSYRRYLENKRRHECRRFF